MHVLHSHGDKSFTISNARIPSLTPQKPIRASSLGSDSLIHPEMLSVKYLGELVHSRFSAKPSRFVQGPKDPVNSTASVGAHCSLIAVGIQWELEFSCYPRVLRRIVFVITLRKVEIWRPPQQRWG